MGPLSLQKGAVWCAYLHLFISLLLNREINYRAVFLFSHYTLRTQKLIDRKNTDCFPLWRERGTIRQDGWWKVEPSMLERRNVDQCDWYIKSMEQHFLSYIPRFLMLLGIAVGTRLILELGRRVTRRKDISKSRKLCLLSVRILLGFAGRYEQRLISRQESWRILGTVQSL